MNPTRIVAAVRAFLATPAGKVAARVGGVFGAAFIATMVASGLDLAHITELAVYQKAVLAGWAAVLQLLGSVTIGGARVVKARRDPLAGLDARAQVASKIAATNVQLARLNDAYSRLAKEITTTLKADLKIGDE